MKSIYFCNFRYKKQIKNLKFEIEKYEIHEREISDSYKSLFLEKDKEISDLKEDIASLMKEQNSNSVISDLNSKLEIKNKSEKDLIDKVHYLEVLIKY